MDVMSKAIDVKLGREFRSGSWFTFSQLMCRSTTNLPYHTNDFKYGTEQSLRFIHQIAMDSVLSVYTLILPSGPAENAKSVNPEQDGRDAAQDFLMTRLIASGSGMGKQGRFHTEGLDCLVMKIYEMLLGIVLIYQGHAKKSEEVQSEAQNLSLKAKNNPCATNSNNLDTPHRMMTDVADRRGPFEYANAIPDPGPSRVAQTKEVKQRCIATLVLFLLFGVQGWFGCLKNRKRYTYRDLYSLTSISLSMSLRGFNLLSPQIDQEVHTPWRRLNSYIVDILLASKIGHPDIDWFRATYIWGAALERGTIAHHFLQDLFEEMKSPGATLSSTGTIAPRMSISSDWTDRWQKVFSKVYVKEEYYTKHAQRSIQEDGSEGDAAYLVSPIFVSEQYEGLNLREFLVPGKWRRIPKPVVESLVQHSTGKNMNHRAEDRATERVLARAEDNTTTDDVFNNLDGDAIVTTEEEPLEEEEEEEDYLIGQNVIDIEGY
ncbi:Golgi to ER traffic- protein [Puccinia graminis f. sp. tritici]|uniref:Golgi to ER traffic-protein n=1 Tax=Puccinia graminis f. sp. tritici TaxID=56615 RepID=A0A5B0P1X1_PUCGR|nr:Golgi to ER traffic- protein [Puccinia graminis f. sp. tritici]KAA1095557.1 Golgi to ER traffic- protein [Puccinia graminis f. sp. tritici]